MPNRKLKDIRKIKPIRGLGDGNERQKLPIKGKELISDLYARVGCIAGRD